MAAESTCSPRRRRSMTRTVASTATCDPDRRVGDPTRAGRLRRLRRRRPITRGGMRPIAPRGRPGLARLRRRMEEAGIDAYFGVRSEHMRYLTGFALAETEEKVAGHSGKFFVGADEVVVLADTSLHAPGAPRGPRRARRGDDVRPPRTLAGAPRARSAPAASAWRRASSRRRSGRRLPPPPPTSR